MNRYRKLEIYSDDRLYNDYAFIDNYMYKPLYPLLFFPAHGKILAWAGRKIYPGREGNLKEYFGE